MDGRRYAECVEKVGIVDVNFARLDLLLTLFAVTVIAEERIRNKFLRLTGNDRYDYSLRDGFILVFVTPKNGWPCLHGGFGEHVIQNWHLLM